MSGVHAMKKIDQIRPGSIPVWMAKLYHDMEVRYLGYVDGMHRISTEKELVRMAEELGLTYHVTLTAMPTTSHGRTIRTAEYAAKVADELAHEVCDGSLIGIGDKVPGGQPHAHVLTTRSDSRKLKDRWHRAGLGHVKVTTSNDDPDAFRRRVLYVLRKWTSPNSCRNGMVYMAGKRLPGRVSRRPRRTTSRLDRD